MGSDWAVYPLEECMDAIIDYRGKTPKKTTSGIPLITAKIIKDGAIQPVNEFIAEEDYELWMRRGIPLPGDVVMTTEAPLGEVAQLDNRKVALAQRVITLRGKKGFLDNTFLKYLMSSQFVQHQLDGRASGTTVTGIKQSELRQVLLRFPPYEQQRMIAHILGSLDDKIELNRRMNETLEAMAQTLFKSWFVDFDPVIDNALAAGNLIPEPLQARAQARASLGNQRKPLPPAIQQQFPNRFTFTEEMGWIPEGWEVSKLSNLLDIRYGKDHKNLSEGSIPVYGSGGIMRFADKSLYEGEAILIPRKGSLNNLVYLNEPFWCVDTIFYSVPKRSNFGHYLFLSLKRFDFAAMNVGSAVPSMTTKVLNDMNFVNPPLPILEKFNYLLEDLFKSMIAKKNSSVTLTKLRDTLLPKLLSGQIRIPDPQTPPTTAT